MTQARPPLIIHSDDMEPKRYKCLSDAADDIKVSKQTLMYAHEKKGLLLPEGKVELKFSTLSGLRINISGYLTTSEHNREATLCLQE